MEFNAVMTFERQCMFSYVIFAINHSWTSINSALLLFWRHHLIALGVAVDVLGCTGTVSQRAAVLHKVILLAQALKEHAHDLYSFSAVMKALEMPQVRRLVTEEILVGWWSRTHLFLTVCVLFFHVQIMRLEMTWRALRRNHTDTAVLFEKKLKPFMNSLNDGDSEWLCMRQRSIILLKAFQACLFDLIAALQTIYAVPSTTIEILIAAGCFTSRSCTHLLVC